MSSECPASVWQVSASVSQVSHKSLTSVSQVPRKCLASVSQVSRKCQTSRECIGETSIVYAYVKGATVECVYLGWLRPPPGAPQQQWCLRECECDVRVDRHATTHGVPYAIRTIFLPFFVSENSAALPISHWRCVYALRIRIIHHSAAPALGNTTDHTSRIRVLSNSIKRRKPAGEGYVLRTTYPYYISSAESPRERAIYYALHIRDFLVVLSLAPLSTSRSAVQPWPVPRVSVRRGVPSNSG